MKRIVFILFLILFASSALAESEAQKFLKKIYNEYGEGLIPKEILERECTRFCQIQLGKGPKIKYLDCFDECLKTDPTGREVVKTCETLLSILEGDCHNPETQRNMTYSLVMMGRFAVKPLVEKIVNSQDDCMVLTCLTILENIGEDAVGCQNSLTDLLLESSDETIKKEITKTLLKTGPTRDRLEDYLKKINDNDKEVRENCIILIGQLGPDALPASGELLKKAFQQDEFISIRKAAISAIGNIGPMAIANVSPLLILMNSEDFDKNTEAWNTPLYAAKSLIQISPSYSRQSVDKIIENIDSTRPVEKDFSSMLLIKLGKLVRTDLDMIRSSKDIDSKIKSRLSSIISEIDRREDK